MSYLTMYRKWLNFDDETYKELISLKESEIKDRFYKELEFGTGGLRGIIGAGTNRVNKYTIRKVTQGLANYIKKQKINEPSVILAYDSRKYSELFAKEAALVLNANQIKTYIFNEMKPTPLLSYAIRKINTSAGIVITASHNPKEYNGYKIYWSDGGQITDHLAKEIYKEIKAIDYEDILTIEYNKAIDLGLYNVITDEIEDSYIKQIKQLTLNKDLVDNMKDKLKIVYTPIHGTGIKPIRRLLQEIGYTNLFIVKEQENPDPNFSTVICPNPEEKEVFEKAVEVASKEDADIIIGTDPDCDRAGVVVKNKEGNYIVLTGNQVGLLLTYYILDTLKFKNILPKNSVVIKTIVTTECIKEICKDYGVEVIDVLTGFKYIGEKIKEFEDTKDKFFLFGLEESYGYLTGTFVRDKDAVIASMLICEMACFYKKRGLSLYEGLLELYSKYGFFLEDLETITFDGLSGCINIENIINKIRNFPPNKIDEFNVVYIKDYKFKKIKDLLTGKETTMEYKMPSSNVIQLILEGDNIITIRPSGTEPKIKIYFMLKDNTWEKNVIKLNRLKEAISEIIKPEMNII
ncbi:phospho-sugar mutase [Anaerobranca gottschalkii]|uniref:Phosphoglucomutase n=1 Tax=Anaerobranca gottschalkii DSM 13577 TaxID=1120990 RepID=A0A1H9YHP2_9FIRM|nr:phospho-sugar mutase [Anaerobranca gottschalkii]SES68572.1 phosphoglucomutase [Anaerobranca gottschalkii DSM 13577]